MKFSEGKLYKCPGYFLYVFPTLEQAKEARSNPNNGLSMGGTLSSLVSTGAAIWEVNNWSKHFKCKVNIAYPEDILLFLEEHHRQHDFPEHYLRFLVTDFEGWVVNGSWLELQFVQCKL